jgi:hypothetical protein
MGSLGNTHRLGHIRVLYYDVEIVLTGNEIRPRYEGTNDQISGN